MTMYFLPEPAVLLAFTAASLVLILTPGPDMTLMMSRALAGGRVQAIACVGGTITGLLVHTVLVAIGVAALVVASPTGFLILKATGSLYLLWLAVQAVRKGSAFNLGASVSREKSYFANWTNGLAVNLLNPKIIIFFMTFLPQFVSVNDPHIREKLLFLGLAYATLSLPIALAIVLVSGRLAVVLKSNPRIMRILDYGCAGVFSLFAVRIIFTQGR